MACWCIILIILLRAYLAANNRKYYLQFSVNIGHSASQISTTYRIIREQQQVKHLLKNVSGALKRGNFDLSPYIHLPSRYRKWDCFNHFINWCETPCILVDMTLILMYLYLMIYNVHICRGQYCIKTCWLGVLDSCWLWRKDQKSRQDRMEALGFMLLKSEYTLQL